MFSSHQSQVPRSSRVLVRRRSPTVYFSRPSARSSVFVLRSANSLATRALRLMTAAMPRADSDGTTGPRGWFDVANVRRERTPAGGRGVVGLAGSRKSVPSRLPAKVRYERRPRRRAPRRRPNVPGGRSRLQTSLRRVPRRRAANNRVWMTLIRKARTHPVSRRSSGEIATLRQEWDGSAGCGTLREAWFGPKLSARPFGRCAMWRAVSDELLRPRDVRSATRSVVCVR